MDVVAFMGLNQGKNHTYVVTPETGGVLKDAVNKRIALYKHEKGQGHQCLALCPHLQGAICWDNAEKSWVCPVHRSRFRKDGVRLMGYVKTGSPPANESGDPVQKEARME